MPELKAEYKIMHLPRRTQEDTLSFCRLTNCTLDDVWNADVGSMWQMGKVHGLIVHLGKRGHYLRDIAAAANVSKDKAHSVIEQAKKPDFPIRTTNWKAMA